MAKGATDTFKCEVCKDAFTARVADRKRGWARCCSKSCAAIRSNRRTGKYARYLHGQAADGGRFIEDLGLGEVDQW